MAERFCQHQCAELPRLASESPSLGLAMKLETAREAPSAVDRQELIFKVAWKNPMWGKVRSADELLLKRGIRALNSARITCAEVL